MRPANNNRPGTCEGCPYKGQTCGSRGDITAEFIVVGEAPGSQEIGTGIPFHGPSGQLLNQCLAKAGLEKGTRIFVTNSLYCRPPVGKPPTKEAIEACRSRLMEQLGASPRRVVLALGNTALRSILHDHNLKITKERGRAVKLPDGAWLVPTIHPAAVLRSPGELHHLQADIRYAVSILQGGDEIVKNPGETKYAVIKTPETAQKMVQGLLKLDWVACDIETSGFDPQSDHILSIGIAWAKNKALIFTPSVFEYLRPLFESKVRQIWHNGKFDVQFVQNIGLPARVDHDTMLLHYTLTEIRGTHDLKQLGQDLCGYDDWDKGLKKYLKKKSDSFEIIPKPVLYKYQAIDCDATYQIFGILYSRVMGDPDLKRLYENLLLPASHFLQQVEKRGIFVDTEELERLDVELGEELEESYQDMLTAIKDYWDPDQYVEDVGAKKTPTEFNPRSQPQVKWVLFNDHAIGMPPPRNVKGEELKNTRVTTLAMLPQHPFVTGLTRSRKASKLRSTYVKGIRNRISRTDRRVHSTFLLHGTLTGRLASRNPNMQNIPTGSMIKKLFRAPNGRMLIEADFSQAELRMLAHLSGDPVLIDVYRRGEDLHTMFATKRFGTRFTSLADSHDKADKELYKELRKRAKFLNFGIVYGRGVESIMQEFKISKSEAQSDIDYWSSTFPVAWAYLQRQRALPEQGKVAVSVFGRKRRPGLVHRETLNHLQNEFANFAIQSAASDLTLHSAMFLSPHILAEWDAYVVNLVHDSILVECPVEFVNEVVQYMLHTMRTLPGKLIESKVPFDADAKVGLSWGSMEEYVEPPELIDNTPPDFVYESEDDDEDDEEGWDEVEEASRLIHA